MNMQIVGAKRSATTKFPGRNGQLELKLGWRGAWMSLVIVGGPYLRYVEGEDTFGVCLREVEPSYYDVWLPIEDFSVPTDDDDTRTALVETLAAALGGKQVYAGCMGGWGRTGLFLSLLAKAAGVASPIEYVRKHYTPHAVETAQQETFVKTFDVQNVTQNLYRLAWAARIRRLFGR